MSTPQEIADMLTKKNLSPNEVNTSEETDDHSEEHDEEEIDAGETGGEEDPDATDEDQGDEDSDEGDESDGEDEGSDQTEYLDLDDNVHVKMRVDGEEIEVPVNELIQSYAGDKTISKRLQEATELRKTAKADYEKAVHEATLIRDAAEAIVRKLDEQLHTPLAAKPDDALKRTNPQRYVQLLDAYEQDQQRINQSRQLLQSAFEDYGKQSAASRDQQRAKTAQAIIEAIPELQSEKTKNPTMEKIFKAGKTYGFSDEEINALEDPRMYIMAYDAMKYREQTQLGKAKPVEMQGKKKVLRAGKARKNLTSRSAQRQVRTAKEKAASSGKPQDVADFLLARNLNKRK